jgi:hypothetical protein
MFYLFNIKNLKMSNKTNNKTQVIYNQIAQKTRNLFELEPYYIKYLLSNTNLIKF